MPEFEVNQNLQLGEQTTIKPKDKPVDVEIKERQDKHALCLKVIDELIVAFNKAREAVPEEAGTSRAIPSLKSNLNYMGGQLAYLKNELQA